MKRAGIAAAAVVGVGLLVAAAAAIRAFDHRAEVATALPRPQRGGPFTLVTTDGTTVTDRTYRGKILLVYFGYTLCPDICPTTLGAIAEAMTALGRNADRVQPLFITIDPRRDTPKVLADFVGNFGPRLIGLTGTPQQIAAVAKEYDVIYAAHAAKDAPDGYLMDHTALVYVMDPEGRFVATFNPETSVDQMVDRLSKLIAPTD